MTNASLGRISPYNLKANDANLCADSSKATFEVCLHKPLEVWMLAADMSLTAKKSFQIQIRNIFENAFNQYLTKTAVLESSYLRVFSVESTFPLTFFVSMTRPPHLDKAFPKPAPDMFFNWHISIWLDMSRILRFS